MEDSSKERTGLVADDDDLFHTLDTSSRIGSIVKAGDITGRFEYGFDSGDGEITTRLLYGRWNIGAGSILVGQDYVPISLSVHTAWKSTLSGYGRLYGGRVPQVKLLMGGLQVALLEPSSGFDITGASVDDDTSLPKIEANYTFKAGPFAATACAGYNTYDETLNPTPTTEKDVSVDSMVYGLGVQYLVGPLRIRADVFAGSNLDEYGTISQGASIPAAYTATGTVEDSDTLGYAAAVNYKISDTLTFDIGYGVQKEEGKTAALANIEQEVSAYYALLNIKLAEGVILTPEVGERDYGDYEVAGSPAVKKGKETRYGVEFKIGF
jgi:hypothetical protein